MQQSFHSICRWTFHSGKGGFVPADIRKEWTDDKFDTVSVINLIREKIAPRLPEHIVLGFELHYDNEVNEGTAEAITTALLKNAVYLAMITPGAHIHYGYGGIASLDPEERKAAAAFGARTVDIAYSHLKLTWHKSESLYPAFVIWNGSFGYDLSTIGLLQMYKNLEAEIAALFRYEKEKGGNLYFAIEPKANEGHAAMLIPTVASALVILNRIERDYGLTLNRHGVNKEFGHSEMIGLDPVYDTVEEMESKAIMHMHINSQGYNDGLSLGGPGKFDIDLGARINGTNIAIAGLLKKAEYQRWKGHDMQPRPYDNEAQAVDRVVRSILSWDACEQAAAEFDENGLLELLAKRETARAEDMMRHAVTNAYSIFDKMYK